MKVNGIILINKPRGISSNSVVNKIKHLLKAEKAGHLGTLDVLGEGLLPVTIGKATKLFDYFLKKDKVYKTVFHFGYETTTLDMEGEPIFFNSKIITEADIIKILPNFIGKQNQMPPIYSAKKINGKKAYQLARAGEDKIELKPKQIEIYDIKLLSKKDNNTFEFEVHCSSGTYIRSLCRDVAYKLSTYATMLSIQRTRCGDFNLENAYSINDVENGKYQIISLDTIFDFQAIKLNKDQTKMLLNGMKVNYLSKDGRYKLYNDNQFLGIGCVCDNHLKFQLRLI